MKKQYKLGVIGGGFMAQAIIGGIDFIKPKKIIVSDPSAAAREKLTYLGVNVTENNRDVADNCEYLLLAVKPQTFPAVAESLKGVPVEKVISIMAGVKKQVIRDALFGQTKVVRVMPNLPCSIGVGMTAIDASELSDPARQFVLGLFLSVGKVIETEESLLNAVTAVSGSGPAYVYLFLRAFIEAAVEQGLRQDQAETLVYQTFAGGLSMAQTSGKSLDELIAAVSSKGGTTIAALDSFRNDGFEKSVVRAVSAAALRADELSQ